MNSTTTNLQTAYQFTRLGDLAQWSNWALLLLVAAAVVGFAWWWSWRDTRSLRLVSRCVLFGLRLATLVAIAFFFFNLEKKTQREVRENSRVSVLVDTSQSMGLPQQLDESGETGPSRADIAVQLLEQSPLLEELRARHDVSVHTFDAASAPLQIAQFTRTGTVREEIARDDSQDFARQWVEMSLWTWTGIGLLVVGVVALIATGLMPTWKIGGVFQLASAVLLLASVIVVGVADLRNEDVRPWNVLLGKLSPPATESPQLAADRTTEEETGDDSEIVESDAAQQFDWKAKLTPTGLETRIGDAIVQRINEERGGPFSGFVLVSDGANNEGIDLAEATRLSREIGARIVTVGLGSEEIPRSIRVVDLEAPTKAYPGDKFQLRGYIQAFGIGSGNASIQVASGTLDEEGEFQEESLEGEPRQVTLGKDGEVLPVDFEVTPDEVGKRAYVLKIGLAGERRTVRIENRRVVNVQVVKQRNRVMLMAGGPTREFRFLRNQLYRDKDVELHVFLQTGQPGISQESDELLFEFPSEAGVLFEQYDCIIAFDPDWTQLSLAQIELLERWVGEKAGGLIVVAGPIFTPEWASTRRGDERIDIIKDLHPVTFFSRGTSIGLGRFGSEIPRKVVLTSEGEKSEAIRLGNSAELSNLVWNAFPGVFGYFTVNGVKPAASKLASVDTGSRNSAGELPVYMASHFYGAGRVVFLGSGEMWRIRSLDVGHFEQFYTKLIRYVSQGRLARDSSRGVLLVSADRVSLGETVEIRAFLTDQQHNPLTDPLIEARLILPDGTAQEVVLRQLPEFEQGQYAGRFTPLQDGQYRIELQLPGDGDDNLLVREVRVRIPDVEIANPRRDDAVLNDLAQSTGGVSTVGIQGFYSEPTRTALVGSNALPARDLFTTLPDVTDRTFQQTLRGWLMALIVAALSIEWIQRRFLKLA